MDFGLGGGVGGLVGWGLQCKKGKGGEKLEERGERGEKKEVKEDAHVIEGGGEVYQFLMHLLECSDNSDGGKVQI